jgi:rhamnogalacturonan endolyase
MKPGTYDVTLFQGELEVGTGRVTVNAGQTASVSVSSSISRPNVIWSIGQWRSAFCRGNRTLTFYIT